MSMCQLEAMSCGWGVGGLYLGAVKAKHLPRYNEVRNMPSSEVDEMICHYRPGGLFESGWLGGLELRTQALFF